MSKLKNFILGAAIAVLPFGAMISTAHAQIEAVNIEGNLNSVNTHSGLGDKPLEETLGMLISVLLGLLGIIFLVLVIWAGFLWMTAGGDEKKVAQAKSIIITAVVGMVILLSAYAISSFVLDQLISATN